MSTTSIRKSKFEHQYTKMFTSLLFCAGFLAVLSTASVSSESRVDFTPYSALLALLTGNRDFALQPNPYHYQSRYYSQHGSKHFNLFFFYFFVLIIFYFHLYKMHCTLYNKLQLDLTILLDPRTIILHLII